MIFKVNSYDDLKSLNANIGGNIGTMFYVDLTGSSGTFHMYQIGFGNFPSYVATVSTDAKPASFATDFPSAIQLLDIVGVDDSVIKAKTYADLKLLDGIGFVGGYMFYVDLTGSGGAFHMYMINVTSYQYPVVTATVSIKPISFSTDYPAAILLHDVVNFGKHL